MEPDGFRLISGSRSGVHIFVNDDGQKIVTDYFVMVKIHLQYTTPVTLLPGFLFGSNIQRCISDEVPKAVGDESVIVNLDALQCVGVMANNNSGTSITDSMGQFYRFWSRVGAVLNTPVQSDDDMIDRTL